MSERDELALELFIGDNANQPRESSMQDWKWYQDAGKFKGSVEHYKEMAEHALAAGYRKPQQVTSAVELDALPRFTVIRSAEGSVFERQTMWHEAGSRDLKYWTEIALPVTVLQMGWGEE